MRLDDSRLSPQSGPDGGEAELPVLLLEVARGDREAFEAVCRRIAAPVFGTIRADMYV